MDAAAHKVIDETKRAWGERGAGSPDLNRHMAKDTPYADWYAGLIRAAVEDSKC